MVDAGGCSTSLTEPSKPWDPQQLYRVVRNLLQLCPWAQGDGRWKGSGSTSDGLVAAVDLPGFTTEVMKVQHLAGLYGAVWLGMLP